MTSLESKLIHTRSQSAAPLIYKPRASQLLGGGGSGILDFCRKTEKNAKPVLAHRRSRVCGCGQSSGRTVSSPVSTQHSWHFSLPTQPTPGSPRL